MDFVSNDYVLDLLRKDEEEKHSLLASKMNEMLTQKDREGFDPYHLALLIKDASTSKLLEEKLNKQPGYKKS